MFLDGDLCKLATTHQTPSLEFTSIKCGARIRYLVSPIVWQFCPPTWSEWRNRSDAIEPRWPYPDARQLPPKAAKASDCLADRLGWSCCRSRRLKDNKQMAKNVWIWNEPIWWEAGGVRQKQPWGLISHNYRISEVCGWKHCTWRFLRTSYSIHELSSWPETMSLPVGSTQTEVTGEPRAS